MLEQSILEFKLPVELAGVIVALYVLGKIIKNTKYIKNELIPVVLLIIGVGFSMALMGVTITSVIGGIIATGLAVFGDQLLKQSKKGLEGE